MGFFCSIIQPVPSTELGPAAQDVCRDGFSYASATSESVAVGTAIGTSNIAPAADSSCVEINGGLVGSKRSSEENIDVTDSTTVTTSRQPFGNDNKRAPGGGRGGQRTGKTDAERVQVRAYLRQGVDRYEDISYYLEHKTTLRIND